MGNLINDKPTLILIIWTSAGGLYWSTSVNITNSLNNVHLNPSISETVECIYVNSIDIVPFRYWVIQAFLNLSAL